MAEPDIIIRIAFTTMPMATTPVWATVTPNALEFYSKRGRQHFLDRIEAGEAITILDNSQGYYWPGNTSSPYSPNILPGKRLNIQTSYGGSIRDVYTGFIEEWHPGWRLSAGSAPIMELRCADLQKNLALFTLGTIGYNQENSGTRVTNILNDFGWPLGARDISAGQTTLQATGTITDIKAMDHLFTVQHSELGIFYQAPDGDVQFENRHHRLLNHTVSRGTFGDDIGEMKYQNAKFSYDDQYLYNDIRITRLNGAEQVAKNSSSSANFGPRSFSRSDLLMTADTEAKDQADYLLSKYKDPALRVGELTIYPKSDPNNLYPKVLGFDISDRITLRLNQASVDTDYYIEGITHRYAATNERWETTWQLSDADTQVYWAIGVAGFSEIGETTRLCY